MTKQLVAGETLAAAAAGQVHRGHMFSMLPGRQADVAAARPLLKIVEKRS